MSYQLFLYIIYTNNNNKNIPISSSLLIYSSSSPSSSSFYLNRNIHTEYTFVNLNQRLTLYFLNISSVTFISYLLFFPFISPVSTNAHYVYEHMSMSVWCVYSVQTITTTTRNVSNFCISIAIWKRNIKSKRKKTVNK